MEARILYVDFKGSILPGWFDGYGLLFKDCVREYARLDEGLLSYC